MRKHGVHHLFIYLPMHLLRLASSISYYDKSIARLSGRYLAVITHYLSRAFLINYYGGAIECRDFLT